MIRKDQHWRDSRDIVERIIVEGDLELLTPAHFGSGDAEGAADLSLLRDAHDGSALLPGASIAGALRNYWRERKWGYGTPARDTALFGAKRGAKDEMEGHQSSLIVEDAIGPKPQVELREGVKIDATTRTAEEKKLFDMEVLQAGTRFPLRFELLIPKEQGDEQGHTLRRELALALEGFQKAEIRLGARKRRGFGKCQVSDWRVWRYNFKDVDNLLAWLAEGRTGDDWQGRPDMKEATGESLAEKLGVQLDDIPDERRRFEIHATFELDGSMLVRSGTGETDLGPDAMHLHRTRYGTGREEAEAVLPGTSLAGVLRARALRIANSLAEEHDRDVAQRLVNAVFGAGPEDVDDKKDYRASRLVVDETTVQGVRTLVQNRIRVDRFTGGAMDNYLFNEAPIFGGPGSQLEVNLSLREAKPHEIGLLLLLLKDLWTGDLPVGGESSIGRGRLRGRSATLKQVQNGQSPEWTIAAGERGLEVSVDDESRDAKQSLEDCVKALNRHLQGGEQNEAQTDA